MTRPNPKLEIALNYLLGFPERYHDEIASHLIALTDNSIPFEQGLQNLGDCIEHVTANTTRNELPSIQCLAPD